MSVRFAPAPVLPTLIERLVSSLASALYSIVHSAPQVYSGMLAHPAIGYVLGTTSGMRSTSCGPKKLE
jgi:hypothetical protein